MSSQQQVDLNDLDPRQIIQLKNQMGQQLDQLQSSYRALKVAQMKYKECSENVGTVSSHPDQEIMVPMTASLYVPGTVADNDKFLIDVGTGYYVEKSAKEAVAFFNARLAKLQEDSSKLTGLIKDKLALSQRIDQVLREKLQKEQAQKAKVKQ